jgi:hypothetical protein
MNTQENNKLIAEFMQSIEDGLYLDGLYFYEGRYYDTNMEFHKSWDWLMPVVNKIRSVDCEFDIEQIGVCDWGDENNPTYISHYEFDLDLTYNAVVEFIKQHNESTD